MEINYPVRGSPKYFLVKDIKVRYKKRKVKKYLGVEEPGPGELAHYRELYANELEMRAARKKAELSSEHFRSDILSREQLVTLEELRYIYQAANHLMTVSEAKVYEQNFEVNYIQGTTAIEGNTLSLGQAYDLLHNGMVPAGKSLREINEVQNFRKVAGFRSEYRGKVTLKFIRNLHALIMANIDYHSAGVFRRIDDIGITGCDIPLTPSIFIEEELEKLVQDYYQRLAEGVHPLEAAVLFHYGFEMVHPFTDGNGRVGRELLNYMLLREKFPRLLFLGKDREKYIGALHFGNDGEEGEMVQVFVELIIQQRFEVLKERLRQLTRPLRKGE